MQNTGKSDGIIQKISNRPIPLFYWSERRFIFRDKENYGDLLGKYLVEKISGRPVKFVHPKKQPWYTWDKTNYLTVGSIIHHATRNSVVWGSGIIDRTRRIASAQFRAVRGPRTRQYLLNQGHSCPELYGDPALLMPLYYNPQVPKKYKLGIIPHYHDFKEVSEAHKSDLEILVIDMMTLDVEFVTREILQCEMTISSSLHGMIISHAYGIPSVWVKYSDKLFGDGVKFIDYIESIDLNIYQPATLSGGENLVELERIVKTFPSLPEPERLGRITSELLTVCPFHD